MSETNQPAKERAQWNTRFGFILAAAGSAVGLGNIWKFPYITGENGGGWFVLIYLVCIALVGLPIMMAEIMIGRAAQRQPITAFEKLQGKKTPWAAVGWLGVICGFIILSYYIVVAGWSMDYTLKSVANFTDEIFSSAKVDGYEYRAKTTMDQMRSDLVKRRAEVLRHQAEAPVKNQAAASYFSEYERFRAAVDASPDPALARERLLEKPKLKAIVEEVELLLPKLDAIASEASTQAKAEIALLTDLEVRDQAEALARRNQISEEVGKRFGGLATDGWASSFWALLFILVTILIVAGGVSKGIERACRFLMPTLICLIIFMVIYGMFQPGFGQAVNFVFQPDLSRLKPSGVLEALGHAFFTLSLGMGAMITYGSYQREKKGLAATSCWIALFDTGIALLACLMIFPIIFSYGMEPHGGPGLVFVSMPLAFAEIGTGGLLLSILFFGLLVFAALTSSISLLEVLCSYCIDGLNWSRQRSAWVVGGLVFLFGTLSAFAMSEGFALASWEPGFGKNFFDTMDYLASNWMLPIGGLFIAVYAGWFMPAKIRNAELVGLSPILVSGWLILIRFIAPLLVLAVVADKVGILHIDELF